MTNYGLWKGLSRLNNLSLLFRVLNYQSVKIPAKTDFGLRFPLHQQRFQANQLHYNGTLISGGKMRKERWLPAFVCQHSETMSLHLYPWLPQG